MREPWQKAAAVFGSVSWLLLSWFAGVWLHLTGINLWVLRSGLAVLGVSAILALFLLRPRQPAKSASASEASGREPQEPIDLLFREAEGRLGRAGRITGLPAIIVLGESGTAKTATVVHSGLEPELLAGQVFHESAIVPTRTLNLWFAQRAIFVEPAGKLLTEPNARARVLARLKPARISSILGRGEQPPRAALLCVDCESFLRAGSAESTSNAARTLREALGEICQSWGINLPVYVLFTKCDRVAHFSEYVANLTNPEAALVFGTTIPMHQKAGSGVYAEQEGQRLTDVFQELVYSLADRRPDFLSREHDAGQLGAIYQFPRELRKLRSLMVQFLVDIGRPSQLRANPFLRGFYFTGVRPVVVSDIVASPQRSRQQEPLMADATGIFGPVSRGAPEAAAQQAPSGRRVPQWVFLSHLFSDVVLKDSAALGSSRLSVKTDFWRRVLFGGAVAASLVLAIAWLISYGNNRDLEDEALRAARAVPALTPSESDPASTEALQRLEAMRQVTAKLRDYELSGPPLSLRWGLYTGKSLSPAASRTYFGHFRRLLLNQTQSSLLSLMMRPSGVEALGYKPVYDALKAYLITTSHPEKSTTDFLPPVLTDHWTKGRAFDPHRVDLARKQFLFYSEQLPRGNPYPSFSRPDEAAVATARRYLSQFAATETLYQAMLAAASQKYASIQFNQLYPGSAEVVRNNFIVPGAFTKGGWGLMHQAIQNPDQYFSGERWVMGDQAYANLDRTRLAQTLQARYHDDFIKKWREFLQNTSVVRYGGISDAAGKLSKLSGNQSPLLAALCVVSQNTSVEAADVAGVFQPAQFVEPSAGCQEKLSAAPNASYMDGLIKLQASLQQLSSNTGSDQLRADTGNSANSALLSARQVAQGFRIDKDGQAHSMVQKLLEDPITHALNTLTGVPLQGINGQGAALCRQLQALMTKYPFQQKATVQASLPEVAAVFQQPTGALWKLYEEHLAKLLVRQGSDFVPNPGGGISVTPEFVRFFNQAAAVSNAFYKGNSQQPQLTFSLTPHPTEGIQGVTLTINGQTMRSGTEPTPWQFSWPGAGAQEVKLMVRLAGGSELGYPSYSGLWAVFQFFADSDRWEGSGSEASLEKILRTSGGVVTIPSTGKPVAVRFDLSMGGAPPILRPGYLASLRCVSNVVR